MGATGGLELVSTFTAPNATISSLDFSPGNGYLYYIATTGNSAETPNTIQHRLRRLSLPGLTNTQNVLNGATEVRRTVQGHLLVTRGQEVRTLSAPNAPTVPAVLASMATNYTWSGGPNNPLQTNVALQPIIAHAEQGVAHRHLGRKHYELTDHLGNVRVVVSDVKLSSLNVNNQPHTFLAQVVSRTDYYAFGSAMPKRHYSSDVTSRGFNGMSKDDEIGEPGCHYFAQFWEYDARVAKRWNMDPITMPWHSPFAVLNCNPMVFVDPQGDSPFGFIGKFFKGIGNILRGDNWSSRTSGRHVGRRKNELPEGTNTSNWHGLLNVFRDLKLGAPAGRMVSQGWVGGGSGSFSDLSGNPIDRTATLNPYRELKDMYGTSRVTVTGLRVWGDADNWPTYAWMNSINRRGISEPLFASTATQLIATWPGSWWWLAGGNDAPKPPPGAFYFQTGFAPGLNALPTLEAGIFPAIFARVQLPVNLIHGLFGAWMGGAFNHKPLWTGDVWKLQFGAYSPNGGSLRYNYEYKARVWQAYRDDDRPWLSRLLYGY